MRSFIYFRRATVRTEIPTIIVVRCAREFRTGATLITNVSAEGSIRRRADVEVVFPIDAVHALIVHIPTGARQRTRAVGVERIVVDLEISCATDEFDGAVAIIGAAWAIMSKHIVVDVLGVRIAPDAIATIGSPHHSTLHTGPEDDIIRYLDSKYLVTSDVAIKLEPFGVPVPG